MSSTYCCPLGNLSLCFVSPLRGTVYKGIVKNLLLNIACIPSQRWSENQNQKKHNTSSHTRIFLPITYPIHLFLSVWLFLCWSLYFPFLSGSCDALFDTRTNFFLLVDHITGCSFFPPLHTAHSSCSQFAAGGWDMHTYENRETCTQHFLSHTCTGSSCWSFMLGEIMNCCLRWVLKNNLSMYICRLM